MKQAAIEAGIRTVTHVAKYFDELKTTARALAQSTVASERGYFAPSEEDPVQGVLISYWQARNAVLELITSFRLDEELSPEDRPAAFLTAFAGALVLIDAARFLRETVHERPVVRKKLNEPAPQFGIPAGVYDTVQGSLVSARNAWHLYHAMRYFEEHQAQLREIAVGELTPVMEIIDRLRHRLDVSAAQFARARLRTRASQVLGALVRDTLYQAIYGLQKLSGNMLSERYVRRGHQPQLPADIAAQVRAMLAPGDVLVTRKEYALTNYFLPGFWPHAALYLGDAASLSRLGLGEQVHVRPRWARLLEAAQEEPQRVLEAQKDGVQLRPLASPLASDSVVVLRPRLSPEEVAQALARVLAHEGKPYDFDFDFSRSDRLVCTEVVYRAYDGVGPMRFPLVRRAGRPTFSGGDLIGLALERTLFDPVAAFTADQGLILGGRVPDLLAAKLRGTAPTAAPVQATE
jgi:hypothetical protein